MENSTTAQRFRAPHPSVSNEEYLPPDRGLMVREPYISFILTNKKRWELRGTQTNIRGRIGLIRSGSGLIVGECQILDCIGPLDFETLVVSRELAAHETWELRQEGRVPYTCKDSAVSKTYAWVLASPILYIRPIHYNHPSGAITFVDLSKPGVLECSKASQSPQDRQPLLF